MLNEQLIRWLSRGVLDKSSGGTARPAVALATDIGLVRKENQDRVACLKIGASSWSERSFFVVAVSDGMGGMKDGGECAVMTIAAFFSSLVHSRSNLLLEKMRTAANDANTTVHQFSKGYGGATLSAVLIDMDGSAISLNVGDSRIYAESGVERRILSRLTIDDSLEEAVGGHGKELLQFVGMGDGLKAHVKYITPDYDKLLITTDGVHFLPLQTMQDVFVYAADPLQAVSRLSALARWSGAPDNATLAVCSISKIEQLLLESPSEAIEIWDSFSELHLLRTKYESNQPLVEVQEKVTPVLISKLDDANVVAPLVKPKRARAKKKKIPKESGDKLQIVIEMDAGMEGGDDSPK